MLHQILSETDILAGWNQACQYQWNATLSIIGFALAYPVCPPTPSALKAPNSAILFFEMFENSFAVAKGVAGITRELKAKAEFLVARFRSHLAGEPLPVSSSPISPTLTASGIGNETMGAEPLAWEGTASEWDGGTETTFFAAWRVGSVLGEC
jgi:hypothetical protein